MDISVIIPTYKPKNYILKCLQSATRQTIEKDRYEIIIVLNGDKEPYHSQIKGYIERELSEYNISLLHTDFPGVSNARNIGIDQAKGTFITFIDDDDWVSDNYLENLLIKSDNESIVEANVLQFEENTGHIMEHFLTKAYAKVSMKVQNIHTELNIVDVRSFLSSACCKLIPRSIIKRNRFDTNFSLGEDSLFMFKISNNLKHIRIASPETIYYISYRNESASHSKYTYTFRVKVALQLTLKYLMVYSKDISHYNFIFFLTRIAATLRKICQRRYQ